MLFAHLSDPDREDPYDDDTYSHPQGEIPGVSALAGLDPGDDLRRENDTLRAAFALTIAEWQHVKLVAERQIAMLRAEMT